MVSTPSPPDPKYPDPPPPVPERSDQETQAMAETQREKFFRRGGRAATLLTGGSGTEGGSAAVRMLGGTART